MTTINTSIYTINTINSAIKSTAAATTASKNTTIVSKTTLQSYSRRRAAGLRL